MVKYCVCAGCANCSLTGHRVHCFPNGKNGSVFRAWVRFVQTKRVDFNAASVTKDTVVCGAHFRQEDYVPGDMMEFRMGFRCQDRVRLKADAVPSIHADDLSAPTTTTAGGSDMIQGSVREPARRELCSLLADSPPKVKVEDREGMEERRSVTPEPAVKKRKLLHHSSPNEDQRETCSALSDQSSENGKESGKKDASCQTLKSEDKSIHKTSIKLENKDTDTDIQDNEEFSTSLSVGDGHYLVDLGSSSEFIVDEECLLQLFKTCRECSRQCTVRKRVKGLKLVISQACCFCQSRFKWTNLLDDDDDDF